MTEQPNSGPSGACSDLFIHGAESEPVPVDPGVRRQILGYNAELMTCRVWFDRGAVGTLHAHPHSQVTFVEKGRFRFRVGDEEKEVGPGDCVLIPSGALHGAVCLDDGILIDNFSPAREDFLGGREP